MFARLISALHGGASEQALRKLRNRLLAANLISLSLVIAVAFSLIYLNLYNRTQNDIRESLSSIPRGVLENVMLSKRSVSVSLTDDGSSPSGSELSPSDTGPSLSGKDPLLSAGLEKSGVSITISGEARIPVDYSKSFVANIMNDGSAAIFSMLDMDKETYAEAIEAVFSMYDTDKGAYAGVVESVLVNGAFTGDVDIGGRTWRYSLEPGIGSFPSYSLSIVFLDIEDTNRGLGALAASLVVIGILAVGAILLVSLFAANRAIRPVEESMTRQRRFVADASHELKTPIAVIAANAEAAANAVLEAFRAKAGGENINSVLGKDADRTLMDRTSTNRTSNEDVIEAAGEGGGEAVSQWIGNIADEAARMSRLVENLLALAKAEEKQADRASFDLIEAACEEADRVEAFLFEKSIAFDFELRTAQKEKFIVSTDLAKTQAALSDFELRTAQKEQLIVNTDRVKMQAALSVLFENAVKYTPEGGRVVMTLGRQAEKTRSGSAAYVSVSNTGAYIPPEDLSRIFDRFYRADPSRSSETGGHGIGLSIASELARSLGGGLTAASVPRADGGAVNTFTLTF